MPLVKKLLSFSHALRKAALIFAAVLCIASCVSPPDERPADPLDASLLPAGPEPEAQPAQEEALQESPELAFRRASEEGRFEEALKLLPAYRDWYLSLNGDGELQERELRELELALLIAAGRVEEARALADQGMEDSLEGLYSLSLVSQHKSLAEREAIYLKMLELQPEESRALSGLGMLELERGQAQEAYRYFGRAILSDPRNAQARYARASLLIEYERPRDAISDLDALINYYPDLDQAYALRALANASNFRAALQDLDRAVELQPDNPWHRVDRGRILMRLGRLEDAEQDFSLALLDEETRDHFLVIASRAQLRDMLGRTEEAVADFQRVFELRPDYYPAYPGAALVYFKSASYQEAERYFLEAAASRDSRSEYYLMAALAGYYRGDAPATNRKLSEWMASFDRSSIWYAIGRFYSSSGNDSNILLQIQNHRDQFQKAQAQVLVGALYMLKGQRATALALLTEMGQDALAGTPEGALAEWLVNEYQSN